MRGQGTYYVGRVLKLGRLDEEKLIYALNNPATVSHRGNAWSFIDIHEDKQSGHHYIFGFLSKYSPEGEVPVVDTIARSEKIQEEQNLLIARSPFIYIPEYSGIAFMNVSNHIDQRTFIRRFCDIVEETHQGFFVECDIDLISDLKTFADKLSALDGIYKLDARISPPNPLFSPLWKSLEEYLRSRNAEKMTIVEDASENKILETQLPALVKNASEQTENVPFIPEEEIPVGDAAILMAIDGYGKGLVKGRRDKELVVIKTSETALNFPFEKQPDPNRLYEKVLSIFQRIKDSRHMESVG